MCICEYLFKILYSCHLLSFLCFKWLQPEMPGVYLVRYKYDLDTQWRQCFNYSVLYQASVLFLFEFADNFTKSPEPVL